MIASIGTEDSLAFGKLSQEIILGSFVLKSVALTLSISKSQSVNTERLASILNKGSDIGYYPRAISSGLYRIRERIKIYTYIFLRLHLNEKKCRARKKLIYIGFFEGTRNEVRWPNGKAIAVNYP